MRTVIAVSGRRVRLGDHVDAAVVAGLDSDGRVVVDWSGARAAAAAESVDPAAPPFLFGLTLCCQASDKGMEDGVFCRACYGVKPDADSGSYLWLADDGAFAGLDPLKEIVEE